MHPKALEHAGELVGVIGSNSAGKTTLMNALSGLIIDMRTKEKRRGGERITLYGSIFFDGEEITESPPSERVKRGIVLSRERHPVFAESSVLENLRIAGYLRTRAQIKKSIAYVFELFPHLERLKSRKAGFMSGGEQQMLAIGMALVVQPRLLLLDEPLLGLSPIMQQVVMEAVVSLKQRFGITVLLSEQFARPVLPVIDRGYVVENGMLALSGTGAQPRINLDAAFDAIQRFRARTMIGVPALYRMILEHSRLNQYDLSSLRYCFSGGDVLPTDLGRRWLEKFGHPIRQGYGATETCGGVAMCPVDRENPPKSVGRVVPSKKVKLVDPIDLREVATGEPGELLVSAPHMVTAYLNKPEETAASFVQIAGETWYRTSDIMSMDAEGNLFFVDRTVDTIKHKGYRISASEVESVLQEHPAVMATCVVGVPDAKVGERIKAYVVLKQDIKGISGYDLIKWCRTTLAPYKIPHYIEFRDMLPKSKVGKLLRREIRDEEKRRKEV